MIYLKSSENRTGTIEQLAQNVEAVEKQVQKDTSIFKNVLLHKGKIIICIIFLHSERNKIVNESNCL